MLRPKKELLPAVALSLGVLGLYVNFLSKAYVFEGLLRAMPIETGRWRHLFAGNYLLYGPLGLVFHGMLQLIGIFQPAVVSLQIMDALIGSAGVFLFYLTVRRLGVELGWSLIWSSVLAFSLGYWLWSTDAENYILSTFLLLLNFYVLVRYAQRDFKDPAVLGAMHALAVMGHIVNVAFGAVILWFLWKIHGKDWHGRAGRYAAAASLGVAGMYAAILIAVIQPASVQDALRWLAGSAGAGADGALYLGGGFTAGKLWEWLKMSAHIFLSFQPAYADPPPWAASGRFLAAAAFLLAVFVMVVGLRLREILRRWPAAAGGCVIWLAAYALIFTRWQPWTMVYRVSDLVPLCLLLALSSQTITVNGRFWRAAAAALAISLGVGNYGAEIHPRSLASNNPHLARMAFVKQHTEVGDWVTGDSGQDEIYIPYFAERRPIVVERFMQRPERLQESLDVLLDQKQTIYVTSRVLQADRWKGVFRRYRLTLKARDGAGFALYRVTRYHRKEVSLR